MAHKDWKVTINIRDNYDSENEEPLSKNQVERDVVRAISDSEFDYEISDIQPIETTQDLEIKQKFVYPDKEWEAQRKMYDNEYRDLNDN